MAVYAHLPFTTKVKNAWNYTSIHLFIFMAQYLIKLHHNFQFLSGIKSQEIYIL